MDIGAGRIRVGRIVPMGLLSTLVVSIDEQLLVTGRPLLIRRMMVIALPRKGLRRDQLRFTKNGETWNETWELISTPSKGVKRDTNLMSLPDSPLLDNPYGSTASLEERSSEKPGQWQLSSELGTPVRSQGRGR